MNRVLRIVLGAAAVLNVTAAILHALDRDWVSAIFAFALAAALITLAILERPRPALAPPERGDVAVTFIGGPLDGADVPLSPLPIPELLDELVTVNGTRYRVTTVQHTCYTAEVDQP